MMRKWLSVLFILVLALGVEASAQPRCEDIFTQSEHHLQPSQVSPKNVQALSPLPRAENNLVPDVTSRSWTWSSLFSNNGEILNKLRSYHIQGPPLGKGAAGIVYRGTLPLDFRDYVPSADKQWQAGKTEVAIKVAWGEGLNKATLDVEAKMSARLEPHDPHSLFLRYYKDSKNGVLVSEFQKNLISLETWIGTTNTVVTVAALDKIDQQLEEALGILQSAQLVHSDLGLQNILINPDDFTIKVIDYGIMSEVGTYPILRKNLWRNKRGGRFKSRNQREDLPAQFDDDVYSVAQTLAALRVKLSAVEPSPENTYPLERDRKTSANEIVSLAPNSPEWLHLTTRQGRISDEGFPRRLHDSMNFVFEPYVDKFLNGQDVNFRDMIRAQHRILTAGVDGQSQYFGASMGAWNKIFNNSAVPGRFRNEAFNGPSFFRWRLTISIQDILGGQKPSSTLGKDEPVLLRGIPVDVLPTRNVGPANVQYRHPDTGAVPIYLKAMQKSMDSALTLMRQGQSRDEVLPYLADYLQRGLAGHIFSVGNFSIYMTQVNGLLCRLGYRGISPANLDYHALVEDSKDFQQRFIREVSNAGNL